MALYTVHGKARGQGGIQRSRGLGITLWARVFWCGVLCLLFLLPSGCADEEGDERQPPLSTAAPPVARVTFPGPVALFTARNVTIRGTAQSQNAITRVTVNGVQATSTDGFATWVARLILPPGTHAVVVSTEDVLGHRDATAATGMVVVGAVLSAPKGIAVEANGQLVVVDRLLQAVLRIDPATGASEVLSSTANGQGPPFLQPVDIAVEANGALLVADRGVGVIRVDPGSGDRHVVSGATVGEGVGLTGEGGESGASSVAVEADGQIVVGSGALWVRVDPVSGNRTLIRGPFTGDGLPSLAYDLLVTPGGQLVAIDNSPFATVVQVDPRSGDRTILSGGFIFDASTIGNGPRFQRLAGIAMEVSGQFVVVDQVLRAVLRVDPGNGNRTILSDATRGHGPLLEAPEGIVTEASGQLLVTDRAQSAIVRIDPASGDRTLFPSTATLGGGAPLVSPGDIALEASGQWIVVDGSDPSVLFNPSLMEGTPAVIRINPTTGDRTIVSDSQTGGGPSFRVPTSLAVQADGHISVVDAQHMAVMQVDPITGVRSVISDAATGSGPFIQYPFGIAVEASGQLAVVGFRVASFNDTFGAVIRVDPVSGVRTRVDATSGGRGLTAPSSIAVAARGELIVLDGRARVIRLDPTTGIMTVVFVFSFELSPTSGRFAQPTDLIVEADGHILVADSGLKAVVRIDPISGERTIVSDASTGSGPGFATPFSLAIEANGQIVVTDVGMRAVLRVDAQSGDRAIISR